MVPARNKESTIWYLNSERLYENYYIFVAIYKKPSSLNNKYRNMRNMRTKLAINSGMCS